MESKVLRAFSFILVAVLLMDAFVALPGSFARLPSRVCEGHRPGLASISIDGVSVQDDTYTFDVSYDASNVWNPYDEVWEAPESVSSVKIASYYFWNRTKAEVFLNLVDEWCDQYDYHVQTERYIEYVTSKTGWSVYSLRSHKAALDESEITMSKSHSFSFPQPTKGVTWYMVSIYGVYFKYEGRTVRHWSLAVSDINEVFKDPDMQLHLSGPVTVDPLDAVIDFDLRASGRDAPENVFAEWIFSYNPKDEGIWDTFMPLKVPGGGNLTLKIVSSDLGNLFELAESHGKQVPYGKSLEMSVKCVYNITISSSSTSRLEVNWATSNTHTFHVDTDPRIHGGVDVSVSGPSRLTLGERSYLLGLAAEGNEVGEINRVRWEFRYRVDGGIWQEWAQRQSFEPNDLDFELSYSEKSDVKQYLEAGSTVEAEIAVKCYRDSFDEDRMLGASDAIVIPVILYDLELEIEGPEQIVLQEGENLYEKRVLLEHSLEGEDVADVETLVWEFKYEDSEGAWRSYRNESGGLDEFYVGGSLLNNLFQLAEEHGSGVEGEKKLQVRVEARAYSSYQTTPIFYMASSNILGFTVGGIPGEETLTCAVTGLGKPIRHAKVKLTTDAGDTYETSTDERGTFSLALDPSKAYALDIEFLYNVDGVTYFILHHVISKEVLTLRLYLDENIVKSMELMGGISGKSRKIEKPLVQGIDLDEYLGGVLDADWLQGVYIHMAEAVDFYKDRLKVDLDFQLPIDVYCNSFLSTSYISKDGKSSIQIDWMLTPLHSANRPKAREYHEFTHYVHLSFYGEWPKTVNPPIPEVNHGGYLNPSTFDSYMEGLAHFMGLVIAEHYGNWWNPKEYPSHIMKRGDVEKNDKPWRIGGKTEELAILGVLWDLYDGPAQYRDKISDLKEEKGDDLKALTELADVNDDGNVNLIEFVYLKVFGENIKDGYIDDDDLLAISFHYLLKGEMMPGKDELYPLFDIDGDDKLDQAEAFLASGYVAGKLNEVGHQELRNFPEKFTFEENYYDYLNDDDGVDFSLDQMWDILKRPHDDFTSVYEAFITDYPEYRDEIDEVFIMHGIWADEDEGDKVWTDDEPYHDANKNGRWDEGEVFVDYPRGGFTYDDGEEVGRSTNYQRDWRRSFMELPGHYISVDNAVPYYTVEYEFWDTFGGEPVLDDHYELHTQNVEGLVYLPMPPPEYVADVTVIGEDVSTGRPLTFTSEEFYEDLNASMTQGYYVEHDFQFSGTLPSPITPPTVEESTEETEEEDTSDTAEDTRGGGIPGFSPMSILLGLMVSCILLILSRNSSNPLNSCFGRSHF